MTGDTYSYVQHPGNIQLFNALDEVYNQLLVHQYPANLSDGCLSMSNWVMDHNERITLQNGPSIYIVQILCIVDQELKDM